MGKIIGLRIPQPEKTVKASEQEKNPAPKPVKKPIKSEK